MAVVVKSVRGLSLQKVRPIGAAAHALSLLISYTVCDDYGLAATSALAD